jgi:membrane protein
MASLRERASARVERFRARHPTLDHVVTMVTHYNRVDGSAQAGAVTYFGFLSFFPILALGFFAVGLLAQVYPELRGEIRVAVQDLLPGVIGGHPGEIPLRTFEDYGGTVGTIGLVAVLYSGLGWLSGMRSALENMFVLARKEQPNFFVGKLRDLATLLLLGVTLVLSVALSGLVAGFSEALLGWIGLDAGAFVPNAVLWLLSHLLAIAASTALLLTMFVLLTQPHVPRRSLVDGAILGAVGFEVLKSVAYFLIAQTKSQPAFQAFGVSLVLVVWINYFSRLVMFAAAYAYTSPGAERHRGSLTS